MEVISSTRHISKALLSIFRAGSCIPTVRSRTNVAVAASLPPQPPFFLSTTLKSRLNDSPRIGCFFFFFFSAASNTDSLKRFDSLQHVLVGNPSRSLATARWQRRADVQTDGPSGARGRGALGGGTKP